MQRRLLLLASLLVAIFILVVPVWAIGEDTADIPNAPIVNDEGGPVVVRGVVNYTNPFFAVGVSEPIVMLEDQTGFVNRDKNYLFPVESQVLGQIISPFNESPFSYTLSLPIVPQAPLNDVDNDSNQDPGVMIFAVAYWSNTFDSIFLEDRDQFGGGWSTAYASTRTSPNESTRGEYIGGSVIIYAPDGNQAFPSGFGDDDMLFTDDDPLVRVPAGYTLVNMDQEPFTFDRSREPFVDLVEGEGAETADYSEQSYPEAFQSLVDKFRKDYAFTEYYGMDWDALEAEYLPRMEDATNTEDFAFALQDFIWEVPDGHVSMSFTQGLYEQFLFETDGGLGIAIRELTDGRIIVNYLLDDSPAANAGIELGDEIVALDGIALNEAVNNTRAWSEPFSTEHTARLQRLRYVTRFPIGTSVDVTFRDDAGAEQIVNLTAIAERDSFASSSFNRDVTGYELPVQFSPIDGYLYVQITDFLDDARLTMQLWERMIRSAIDNDAQGIIIDMRNNGGGRGFLADQMAAYFFDEEFELGTTAYYDEEQGEFVSPPEAVQTFFLPSENLRYFGDVVVLVSPNCSSACEFFSYNMTVNDRADIIGHYPTGGLGGSVERVFMPDGISVQMTIGRAMDMDGNIHIEGQGVAPTVLIPVTEETLFSNGDPLLEAAVDFLNGELDN